MKFGAFFAPMHPNTVNPTLALERDLDLIKWLDELTYDEAWVGEHHSGAYECIASLRCSWTSGGGADQAYPLATGVSSLFLSSSAGARPTASRNWTTTPRPADLRRRAGAIGGRRLYDGRRSCRSAGRRMDESLGCLVRLLSGEVVTCKDRLVHAARSALPDSALSEPDGRNGGRLGDLADRRRARRANMGWACWSVARLQPERLQATRQPLGHLRRPRRQSTAKRSADPIGAS